MPAKSKAQQAFMAMVSQYKKGELPNASKAVKDAAKNMSLKDAEDFAKTDTKDLPDKVEEKAERDYKAEYKKFQSSDKMKKYRTELNKYNRDKGTYGNGDGKDASHKNGKIVGFEAESKNRGRREKSRLKKEDIVTESGTVFRGSSKNNPTVYNAWKSLSKNKFKSGNVKSQFDTVKKTMSSLGFKEVGRYKLEGYGPHASYQHKEKKFNLWVTLNKYTDGSWNFMVYNPAQSRSKGAYGLVHIENTPLKEFNMNEAKKTDLMFGHLGNGLTVWDRNREEHGDYKGVAHISAPYSKDRKITWWDKKLSSKDKITIGKHAKRYWADYDKKNEAIREFIRAELREMMDEAMSPADAGWMTLMRVFQDIDDKLIGRAQFDWGKRKTHEHIAKWLLRKQNFTNGRAAYEIAVAYSNWKKDGGDIKKHAKKLYTWLSKVIRTNKNEIDLPPRAHLRPHWMS